MILGVGWVERSETQQYQSLWLLGFVPQPNLHLFFLPRVTEEGYSAELNSVS